MPELESSQESIVVNADSKGVIEEYFNATTGVTGYDGVLGRTPRILPSKALKLIRNDPVVRAAIIKIVDKVVESGWRIQPIEGNQKARTRDLERKLKEVRFDKVLRKAVYHLVMYNNAFIEIRKKGGVVHDLNIIEPEYMRIQAADNGDIEGYFQQVGDTLKGNPRWTPEEIVHLKLDDFTTNVWTEFNIEAIYETVAIKDYARQILLWQYGTNQFRPVLSVENTNSSKMKELLAYLKASENHVKKPIPVEGKLVVVPLQDPSSVDFTLKVITWCNTEIHKLLQVPEIAVGTSDNGGRADGAEQREYLNTRVFNIHRILEDEFTYDLFPKIGFGKNEFIFGILDETVRTRVFENVQMMRNSMFTEDAIIEYMESQGIVFETAKPLRSQEEIMTMSNKNLGTGNEGMKGNQSADAAQSRSRQNSQDVSKANRQVA